MISYPRPRFDQQKAEVLQRYKILNGAEGVNTSPAASTVALVFNMPVVLVALTERYRGWFRVSHGVGEEQHEILQGFCATSILSETSFAITDVREESYFSRDHKKIDVNDIVFYAGAPLRNPEGQRFGTLCLIDHCPREMTVNQKWLLESFATLVSSEICLRSAGRYAVRDLISAEQEKCSLYDMAMTDPLTGAFNRRAMYHFSEREVKRAIRHGLNLSVIMLDIDFFKKVNDIHGHAAGDEVLRKVSALLLNSIRDEDILSRVGGEEFALFLPETRPIDALTLTNRLRKSISGLRFVGDGGPFSVTISMGISEPFSTDTGIKPAMERADKALYDAKRGGRNRVVIGEVSDVTQTLMRA